MPGSSRSDSTVLRERPDKLYHNPGVPTRVNSVLVEDVLVVRWLTGPVDGSGTRFSPPPPVKSTTYLIPFSPGDYTLLVQDYLHVPLSFFFFWAIRSFSHRSFLFPNFTSPEGPRGTWSRVWLECSPTGWTCGFPRREREGRRGGRRRDLQTTGASFLPRRV